MLRLRVKQAIQLTQPDIQLTEELCGLVVAIFQHVQALALLCDTLIQLRCLPFLLRQQHIAVVDQALELLGEVVAYLLLDDLYQLVREPDGTDVVLCRVLTSGKCLEILEQKPPQHITEAAYHAPLEPVTKPHDLPPVLIPCVAETPPHGAEYLKLVHVIYRPAIAESLSALYCCTSRVYLGFSTVGRSLIRRWNSCMP